MRGTNFLNVSFFLTFQKRKVLLLTVIRFRFVLVESLNPVSINQHSNSFMRLKLQTDHLIIYLNR